jgi:ATP-binding cassette subfamily B protein
MGLLEPTNGKISVDNNNIYSHSKIDLIDNWRSLIAHVPQNIYLADCSIAQNIALGIPESKIDFARVREAAEKAQIAEYIESKVNGYNEIVGEQGIRLSGGQRQRIGIARALYQNKSFLIFDEATSALDNATESAVMNSINDLSRDLTFIIIAHRISTLNLCDRVIEIENGKIKDISKK